MISSVTVRAAYRLKLTNLITPFTFSSTTSRRLSSDNKGDTGHHQNHGHSVNGICSVCSGTKVDSEGYTEPWIPPYPAKSSESIETKRSRLLYQSRKRGMLENDLLLSTFASEYLCKLDSSLLQQYDNLINGESNDWEIYYWINKQKATPAKFDNEIMNLLKTHAANLKKEKRIRQPDL